MQEKELNAEEKIEEKTGINLNIIKIIKKLLKF